MMTADIKSGQNASQTVSTSVLRVFGASAWSGEDSLGQGQHRYVTACVCSGSDCFFQVVDATASLAGLVSSSDYLFRLSAGQSLTVELSPGETVAVVSAGSSTVRAKEEVVVN